MKFKIEGPYSEDDLETLYWSNDLGWVDFDSATTFSIAELHGSYLPIEFTAFTLLEIDGSIREKSIGIEDFFDSFS